MSTGADGTLHERPAEILQTLIRFDTTNPPGNSATTGSGRSERSTKPSRRSIAHPRLSPTPPKARVTARKIAAWGSQHPATGQSTTTAT